MRHLIARPLELIAHHLNSWHQVMRDRTVLEVARTRSLVSAGVFLLGFFLIAFRLTEVMLFRSDERVVVTHTTDKIPSYTANRADILDRNGEILATHLVTGSVYANPKVIINPEEAASKLTNLIPDLNYDQLLKKLRSDKGFIWIVRHIPPRLQNEVNRLGIPGVYLQKDERRVYPFGNLVSHVLGYCGVDNEGLGGVEKYFDRRLRQDPHPIQLSIDIRVQHVVRQELEEGIKEFQAEGGNAIVMNAKTGEILSMVSLPDFDPNLPNHNPLEATFNRNTLGLYESGSTFKIFNTAIALESGKAKLTSLYDASAPIKVGSKRITDFKGKNRMLDVREVFIYSSNIGSAKMALDFGAELQQQYLGRFGMLTAPNIELPEIATPLVPKTWREVTTMTVAYGYGIAVSPLMLVDGVRAVIMGSRKHRATLLKRDDYEEGEEIPVVSEATSRNIRELMRLVTTEGTAKKANVPGYDIICKTGTAHKNEGRAYKNARLSSILFALPKDNPQYIGIIFLDNPKPTKSTYGYATGGWTAAPVAGRMIARLAPLMGVQPINDDETGKNGYNNNTIITIRHTVDRHHGQR
jgi:cell division protein FtsI (penicillin-binding protein 3)